MGNLFTVVLPDIGEGVVEGEVIEWLKKEGDSLFQDEPVVVVMTDKATVELPAPYPGILTKQYVPAGKIAIKDKPLYDIEREGGGEELPKEEVKQFSIPLKKAEKLLTPYLGKALATPAVRGLAKKMGVDLSQVIGSGKEGRVLAEDLAKEKETRGIVLEGDLDIPLKGIKGAMAKAMAESKRTIPHFSFFEAVEVSRLLKLRESFKKEGDKEGLHVTFLPFFIRALSLTIAKHAELNATFEKDTLHIHKTQNIGIAMSTPDGLIVPVLKGVEKLSLEEIIRAFETLKERMAAHKFTPDDMRGGTVTISNYGVFGGHGLWATPIIPPSQVAILAINRIERMPWVRSKGDPKEEELVIGEVLHLSWSFDHRVIDGDLAAHISHDFARLVENPAALL